MDDAEDRTRASVMIEALHGPSGRDLRVCFLQKRVKRFQVLVCHAGLGLESCKSETRCVRCYFNYLLVACLPRGYEVEAFLYSSSDGSSRWKWGAAEASVAWWL